MAAILSRPQCVNKGNISQESVCHNIAIQLLKFSVTKKSTLLNIDFIHNFSWIVLIETTPVKSLI